MMLLAINLFESTRFLFSLFYACILINNKVFCNDKCRWIVSVNGFL